MFTLVKMQIHHSIFYSTIHKSCLYKDILFSFFFLFSFQVICLSLFHFVYLTWSLISSFLNIFMCLLVFEKNLLILENWTFSFKIEFQSDRCFEKGGASGEHQQTNTHPSFPQSHPWFELPKSWNQKKKLKKKKNLKIKQKIFKASWHAQKMHKSYLK